jgi:NCS1 family nucleobase:cation symporter-1
MSVDYYLIKKGNINLTDLYVGDSSSRYWFYKGWNPRAVIVTVAALIPCLPSFAASIDPNHLGLSVPAQNMFYISFSFTYVFAGLMYWGSYILFPEKKPLFVKESTLRFEQWADDLDERERMAAAMFVEDGEGIESSPRRSADEKDGLSLGGEDEKAM